MEVVTKAEHDRVVAALNTRMANLEAAIAPFLKQELDGEKVVDWREACKYVNLTPYGLSDARRKGRIISDVKINAKEFGYKIKHLELYKKRYCHNGN